MVNNALLQLRKFNHRQQKLKIADFGAGEGVFIDHILNHKEAQSLEIYAHEIDQNQCENLILRYEHQQNVSVVPGDLLENCENQYDLIISNPPYVSSSVLTEEYKSKLRNRYSLAQNGVYDLSLIFVEQIVRKLNENGIASVIFPNKFMTSKYGEPFCHFLSQNANIIKIENFYDFQIFPGVTTYTCIVTFTKSRQGKKFLYKKFVSDPSITESFLNNYEESSLSSELLQKFPWSFTNSIEKTIIEKCTDSRFPFLNDIFPKIVQSVRTCANDVFIVQNDSNLEKQMLRPFITGEEIKDFSIGVSGKSIIYPYTNSQGGIEAISEPQLSQDFPNTYKYLSEQRERLAQRSSQKGLCWFEYGRRQGLEITDSKKILVKEMMPEAVFAIDSVGNHVLASGYALLCDHLTTSDAAAYAAILSTPTMEFLMRQVGTQLHSGWFRLMKHHLQRLQVPLLSQKELKAIANAVISNNYSDAINFTDRLVRSSFGITTEQSEYINKYLQQIHKRSKPERSKNELNKFDPAPLKEYIKYHVQRDDLRRAVTFSLNKNTPLHSWYKYTQGFSATLVHALIDEFKINSGHQVLDLFNGCGTTTTVCAYRGIPSIGVEISPFTSKIASIKSRTWNELPYLKDAINNLEEINLLNEINHQLVFPDFFEKAYSQSIIKQLLKIATAIKNEKHAEAKDLLTIGFVSILEEVSKLRKHGSHYRFLDNTSSIGLQKLNIEVVQDDCDVIGVLRSRVRSFYDDICKVGGRPTASALHLNASADNLPIENETIDCIITSPPYLNRNNYIAQQKAELDLLQLINRKEDYKQLVTSTFRSHTDGVLSGKKKSSMTEINHIIKNIALEEGNNKKIPNMIIDYFEDMDNVLREGFRVLKNGGKFALVLGNTRWGGVVLHIDHIVCKQAESIGYRVKQILVTRMKGNSPQQMKAFGKIPVRESIVILEKPI